MQLIGKSKIGKLSAKKDEIYAQSDCCQSLPINSVESRVYETERDGKLASLLATERDVR